MTKSRFRKRAAIRIGPFGSALKKDEYSELVSEFWESRHVFPNALVSDNRKFIPEAKYRELRQYTVAPGDILVIVHGNGWKDLCCSKDLERR